MAVGCAGLQALGAAENFSAAVIHPGDKGLVLTLYPMTGTALDAPLPAGLPREVTVNAFWTTGNAIYVQKADQPSEGIIKIEFQPLRKSIVDGTAGFSTIWNMAVLPSGRIVVSGISKIRGECGTFEIDPIAGKERTLLAGPFPDCGGGGGAISPDGRRVVSYSGKELSIIDLGDGAVTRINGIPAGQLSHSDVTWSHKASWSPDGKWISVFLKNRDILLLDASDTSKRTNLGPSEGPPAVWSPDSKHLLVSKSDCLQYQYVQSLVSIDVTTHDRRVIQSSRCRIGPGWFGWVDFEAVR